ncbi:MAG: hypothetical protein RR476_02860 [Cetobacterium sp.]
MLSNSIKRRNQKTILGFSFVFLAVAILVSLNTGSFAISFAEMVEYFLREQRTL